MAHTLLYKYDMMMQQTIKDVIRFSGIGLHTGNNINVRILPAGDDRGITFVRKDIPGSAPIKAEASNVVATSYATSLGSKGATVSTVEHIMAALYGLGVDNAVVEVDGPEVPIMDGSAADFVELIEAAGLVNLYSPKRYLVVKKPIKVADGDKHVLILPAKERELTISYSIDFKHPFLSKQSFSMPFSRDIFRREVGGARTFGFLKDAEMLRANGLAKGASLANAIVISDTEILNEDGLRYPDEFVRHKVLDLMGDVSLLGLPIIGHVIAHRSGHALNHKLIKEVLCSVGKWEIVEAFQEDFAANSGYACAATL